MTIGVAVGGSVYQNLMKHKLRIHNLPVEIAENAEGFIRQLREMPENKMKADIIDAYVYGFKGVFIVLTAVIGAAFVANLFIQEYSLDQILDSQHVLKRKEKAGKAGKAGNVGGEKGHRRSKKSDEEELKGMEMEMEMKRNGVENGDGRGDDVEADADANAEAAAGDEAKAAEASTGPEFARPETRESRREGPESAVKADGEGKKAKEVAA